MMTKDFKDLLKVFNARTVKYLLIGGHAFGVHAQPRATKDLEIFIHSDPENARAVFNALAEFGAPLQGMSPADFADGTTFQIGEPPDRILRSHKRKVPHPRDALVFVARVGDHESHQPFFVSHKRWVPQSLS